MALSHSNRARCASADRRISPVDSCRRHDAAALFQSDRPSMRQRRLKEPSSPLAHPGGLFRAPTRYSTGAFVVGTSAGGD